jgi:hypothetical protein
LFPLTYLSLWMSFSYSSPILARSQKIPGAGPLTWAFLPQSCCGDSVE